MSDDAADLKLAASRYERLQSDEAAARSKSLMTPGILPDTDGCAMETGPTAEHRPT